ncbi:MAG: hypothetical protein WBL72_23215, partial [Thermoguttaceae bacterium]
MRAGEKHPAARGRWLCRCLVFLYHGAGEEKARVDAAWVQNYDPLGSAALSTAAAGLPIVVLLGLLLAGVAAPRAALAGLL